LEAFNIRPQEVIIAVETKGGAERTARLAELAQGMPERADLFAQLVAKYDAMQAAHTAQLADVEAKLSNEYDALKLKIDATNLRANQLEVSLEKPADQRKADLDAAKTAGGALPARAKAIDDFVTAFDAYHGLKGALDDAAELKRNLQGSGVLEFHIALSSADSLSRDTYERLVKQLHTKGPRAQAGDELAWFQLDRPESYHSYPLPESFNDKQYILCWITPEKSVVNGPGLPRWAMEKAMSQQDLSGGKVVAFQLDATGGKLFQEFTGANLKKPLSAILDRKIISVATIQSAIGSNGQISGDYSTEDLKLSRQHLQRRQLAGSVGR